MISVIVGFPEGSEFKISTYYYSFLNFIFQVFVGGEFGELRVVPRSQERAGPIRLLLDNQDKLRADTAQGWIDNFQKYLDTFQGELRAWMD